MAKWFFIGLFLMALLQQTRGQEQLSKKQRADQLFERYEYQKSLVMYLELAEKYDDIRVTTRIADCYRLMNHFEDAEKWYARVLSNNKVAPINHYHYAEVLLRNLKAGAAKDQFKRYYTGAGKADQLAKKLATCDSAAVWIRQKPVYVVKNEQKLNSAFSDWGLTWYGKTGFIFASDRTKNTSKQGDDIYNWTGNGYLKPYEVKGETIAELPVSADESYHIGPMAFNAAQDTAYVTITTDVPKRNISIDKKNKNEDQRLYTRRLELMLATKTNGRWGNFSPFAYNNVNAYSVGHAALSKNGQLLYFTSDMPGGEGKTDIWYCEKQADGKWAKPVNCGKAINTADEEAFAQIGGDGALYFASKGLPGMGGYDIYKSTGQKSDWTAPINLKYPVNSTSDDFGLITKDGLSGYFASNRQGGKGDDDIYSFNYQEPDFNVAILGYIYNKNTGERIDSATVLLKKPDGAQIAQGISLKIRDFFFKANKGQDYKLDAGKTGYYPATISTSTKGITHNDTLHVKIPLEPLTAGKTFVLNNIYYDLDKSDIRPDAAMELDKLVKIMQDNPKLRIELASHTDSRAPADYNMALSDRRAKAAVAYLVSKGISPQRLVAQGYGETRLINKCAKGVPCTEAEHQLNRRTEVKVLED